MSGQMRIIDYTLSDVFTLDPENRRVIRAKLVPWEMAEEKGQCQVLRRKCYSAELVADYFGGL